MDNEQTLDTKQMHCMRFCILHLLLRSFDLR